MSTITETDLAKTGEPVLLFGSILAGLTTLFSGAAAIAFVTESPTIMAAVAVGGLATAAATVGLQFFVRGKTTPTEKAQRAVDQAVAEALADPPVEAEEAEEDDDLSDESGPLIEQDDDEIETEGRHQA